MSAARTTAAEPVLASRRWSLRAILLVGVSVSLSGCARHYAGVDDPYGFWSWIWHGIVFPYALIANIVSWLLSLFGIEFMSSIQLVGRPNTGLFFYWIGYLIGLGGYGGSAAR